MPIVWPPGIPQTPLLEGFREQTPETAIRTQMETGPPKMRRRFTAGVRFLTVPLMLTSTQVADLDTFYQTTTEGGTQEFQWTHPRTGSTGVFRFAGVPSQYEPISATLWRTTVRLELLP